MKGDLLRQFLSDTGWRISDSQIHQFELFACLLTEWNQKMNITSLPAELFEEKHFVDSLLFAKQFEGKEGAKIIDVGTGGGFPGVPLQILFPNQFVTLADSLAKRLTFLKAVIEKLGLNGATTVHGRAEDLGRNPNYREQFQVATARAVASLPVLLEFLSPFVSVGGKIVALKGPEVAEELKALHGAEKELGLILRENLSAILPVEGSRRKALVFEKVRRLSTEYPRPFSLMKRRPLGQK
jgi:16S rRNA (guanine527-N7)-methyltransferase